MGREGLSEGKASRQRAHLRREHTVMLKAAGVSVAGLQSAGEARSEVKGGLGLRHNRVF
jgi:hypothetical protein